MKTQKYILSTILILSSVILITGVVHSQTTTPKPSATIIPSLAPSEKPKNLDQIKKRITQRIDQRIQQLKQINERIQKSNKLSDDVKKMLAKDITTAIDKLITYKTDVVSATDVQALMKLVSKVYDDKDFRTILNEISLLERYEKYSDLYTELNTLITKVQTEVDTQKTAGKDVTDLQTKLDDAKKSLADAKTSLDDVLTTLGGVKSDDAPGKNASLTKVRTDLDTAKKDLRAAAVALKQTTGKLKNGDEKLSVTPGLSVKPTEPETGHDNKGKGDDKGRRPNKPTPQISQLPTLTPTKSE